MFYRDGILERSALLSADPAICHGFSTRSGGVSTLSHTASMNVARGHGDPDEVVRKNIGILARAVSKGALDEHSVVYAHQIHSAKIRRVTAADAGSGVTLPAGEDGDGFITDAPGILLMISVADCTPLLFSARRADGLSVVCAVHAGWRGTVAGIAAEAVRQITGMGGELSSLRCAVGQAIGSCCYEVKEDFRGAVIAARGRNFADAHIRCRDGKLFADVPGMNEAILREAGMPQEQIDRSLRCTACAPKEFHSHRASRGVRGAMGALIGIQKAAER